MAPLKGELDEVVAEGLWGGYLPEFYAEIGCESSPGYPSGRFAATSPFRGGILAPFAKWFLRIKRNAYANRTGNEEGGLSHAG